MLKTKTQNQKIVVIKNIVVLLGVFNNGVPDLRPRSQGFSDYTLLNFVDDKDGIKNKG